MPNKIKIIPAQKEHYQDFLKIFNECFLPKFRFIIKDSAKQESFAHDFGLIDFEMAQKNFVAVEESKILGILQLKLAKHGKEEISPKLSPLQMLKKYGLFGLIRAGILGYLISKHKPAADEVYIDNVGVSTLARGKGVGSLLLDFAEDFAKEKSYNKMALSVMYENERAKSLYEKLGYKVVGNDSLKLLKKSTGYSGAWLMEKRF